MRFNTRAYKLSPRDRKKRRIMANKIWIGAIVINGCLIVASADLTTLTFFIVVMLINVLAYTFFIGKE